MEKPAERFVNGKERVLLGRMQLEQEVRERAWKDESFREEFLINAKAVLERDYGQWFPEGQIPSEISIRVIEPAALYEQTVLYSGLLPSRSSVQQGRSQAVDNSALGRADEAEVLKTVTR